MQPAHLQMDQAADSALVTKTFLRAADRLRVANKVLARVIGLSEATVSRLRNGTYQLASGQKEFELASGQGRDAKLACATSSRLRLTPR